MENSKDATIRLAEEFADRDDPNGWFEAFYAKAGGDINKVYWADLKPNPLLLDWLSGRADLSGKKAITIGCGLGDDAEALAQQGYQVTAFDISPSAIDMCQQRYPDSPVEYLVADLFNLPVEWQKGFDLIYECNTIQILKGPSRVQAVKVIADLVAPGGELLVSCRSRESDDHSDTFPIAVDRDEIDGFKRAGLSETHFNAYDDDQEPPVPHFFSVYTRPS